VSDPRGLTSEADMPTSCHVLIRLLISGHSISQEMTGIELTPAALRHTMLQSCTIIIVGWTNREWTAALYVARRLGRAQVVSRPNVVSRLL